MRPKGRGLLDRRVGIALLISSLVVLVLAIARPSPIARLDDDLYDSMTRRRSRETPSGRVVIVDIDERSLGQEGQWPWPRDRVGALIQRIRSLGATTVALDIVFAERDRHSGAEAAPPRGDSRQQPLPRTDLALADTLRQGRVVLGYAMTFDDAPLERDCVLHPLRATVVEAARRPQTRLYRASGAVCNLSVLAEAAGASGFLNAAPDRDGILRRVPLVIELDGQLYPALSLAAVLAMSGGGQIALRIADAQTTSLTIGARVVPLDGNGNLLVRYIGSDRTFRYVSAADVMAGRVGPEVFAGKLVFVGATALGTQEDIATPVKPLFPGVEVQATLAESLLEGRFVRRPGYAPLVEAALVVVGALTVWSVSRLGFVRGAALLAAVGGLLWLAAYRLFAQGLFVSPVLPTFSAMLAYTVVVIVRLRGERTMAVAQAGEAQRAAAAAESVTNEVLRKASHELRTPLTVIAGWAHLLGIGALSDRQKKAALVTIRQNVEAQTRLIEHLVEASTLADSEIRLQMRRVDVQDVVRPEVARYADLLQAKRIRFDVTMESTACIVSADTERLRQIVDALLSNAVKFTPEGGHVALRVGRVGGNVEIVVSDDGVGIAPAFLPHVFDRFRQQHDMTRTPEGGLGLGLAIVDTLVRLHGGSVTAESKGENQGATFVVWLPAVVGD